MTLAHWRDFWGDPTDRPNPYGTRNAIYAEGYHRGEDVANNGDVEFVPVLRPGVIVASGTGLTLADRKIGPWVAVKPDTTYRDRPEYDIYCHMYGPAMLRTGRVQAGDILTRTAGVDDVHGSSWGGPHLHFVVAEHPTGAYDTNILDYNPNPIIDAALAGAFTAAPTGTPLPTPEGPPMTGTTLFEAPTKDGGGPIRALGAAGYWYQIPTGEFLTIAAQIADRTIRFGTYRELQVARAQLLQGLTPQTSVVLSDEQITAISAAAAKAGVDGIRSLEFIITAT
jgi:hypothetical protein